jgi:hypothetical protein
VGQEIVYCFKCQRRIVGHEFADGHAYQIGHHVTCAACAVHLLETLGPREKEQLLAQMFKTTQDRQKSSSASRPDLRPPSTSRQRAVKGGRKTTSSIPVVRLPRSAGAPSSAVLGVSIGAVVVVGLGMAVLLSGSKPPPPPPPKAAASTAAPAPDALRNREAGRAAVQAARAFAAAHPRDHAGQLAAWERAAAAAERTPHYEEARRELGALTLRRKEEVARELAELDGRIRGFLKDDAFRAATVLLQDALARREGPDWTPAVDTLQRQVREAAQGRYRALKAAAVEAQARRAAAEVQAFREKVTQWGFADLIADLETLPPPPPAPEERPWTSLLTTGLRAIRNNGDGGWTFDGGALVKSPSNDQAAQTQREFEDGELRVRFESADASMVWFSVRQGRGGTEYNYGLDFNANRGWRSGPHELVFVCTPDGVTATFDGAPMASRTPGNARRGMLQFNSAPPGTNLRILALDYRPLR